MATEPFGKLTITENATASGTKEVINETIGYVKVNPFDSADDVNVKTVRTFARHFVSKLTTNTLADTKIAYDVSLENDWHMDSDGGA